MTAWLHMQGYPVERKRVRRLLQLMGLETIYPKPHISMPGTVAQRYPYLLRGMSIERCNQVWSCDVRRVGTYGIPVKYRRGREYDPLGHWLTWRRKAKGTGACRGVRPKRLLIFCHARV